MADEYIKKSDVKKAMHGKYADEMRKYPEFITWLKNAVDIVISEIPTADVQPVRHGYWIDEGEAPTNGNFWRTCSECYAGDLQQEYQEVPYCWKCGAKMDGKQNDT